MSLPPPTPTGTTLNLPWRWIALVSLITNLALLAGLVTVVTINGTSALATVALTVAILAFLVQMIVFFLQSWASNQQMLRAEQLHSDSQQLLTRVQASSDQSLRLIEEQLQPVLAAAIRETVTETKERAGGPEFEQRLIQNIQAALAPLTAAQLGSGLPVQTARPARLRELLHDESTLEELAESEEPDLQPSPEDVARWERLKTPLSPAASLPLRESLARLSPDARRYLQRFASDAEVSYRIGVQPGLWLRQGATPRIQELVGAGLMEATERSGRPYGVLTDAGLEMSRLLV